jgi:hypothetical protein
MRVAALTSSRSYRRLFAERRGGAAAQGNPIPDTPNSNSRRETTLRHASAISEMESQARAEAQIVLMIVAAALKSRKKILG